MGTRMRRHVRKDVVVEYDIVILVIIYLDSYKDIERNKVSQIGTKQGRFHMTNSY